MIFDLSFHRTSQALYYNYFRKIAVRRIVNMSEVDTTTPLPCDPQACDETAILSDGISTSEMNSVSRKDMTGVGTEPLEFRMVIENIPTFLGVRAFKETLEKLSIYPTRIKRNPNWHHAYLSFTSKEANTQAIQLLDNFPLRKNHLFHAREVSSTPVGTAPGTLKKRSTEDNKEGNQEVTKKAKESQQEEKSTTDQLLNQVTPLWQSPYSTQLDIKQDKIKRIMRKFQQQLQSSLRHCHSSVVYQLNWLFTQPNTSPCCSLLPMLPSPVIDGYRNKCEFAIGVETVDNKDTVVVGFTLGTYKEGNVSVADSSPCRHVDDVAKHFARLFQDYLATKTTTFAPYNRVTHEGHYRLFTVRHFSTGDTMLIIQIHPQTMTETDMLTEESRLASFFEHQLSTGKHVVNNNNIDRDVSDAQFSVLIQYCSGVHHGFQSNLPLKPIYCRHPQSSLSSLMRERLLGMEFQVSPASFFQTNTAATEILYQLVVDWCFSSTAPKNNLPEANTPNVDNQSMRSTIILDVCCGTGTIGLAVANEIKKARKNDSVVGKIKVVGIEMIPSAIEDAKRNAALNGLEEWSEWHCGKVEDVLEKIVVPKENSDDPHLEMIAILDPPRTGVHTSVIHLLRRHPKVKKVIYIACSPEHALSNWVDLCRPESNKLRGAPFKPTRSQGVDMFPHTEHMEMVIEFTRD